MPVKAGWMDLYAYLVFWILYCAQLTLNPRNTQYVKQRKLVQGCAVLRYNHLKIHLEGHFWNTPKAEVWLRFVYKGFLGSALVSSLWSCNNYGKKWVALEITQLENLHMND